MTEPVGSSSIDVEAAPTVRFVLEHSLTAHWIVQYGNDAMFAIVNIEQRQGTNVANTIEELQAVLSLAGSEELARGLREEVNSEKTAADIEVTPV